MTKPVDEQHKPLPNDPGLKDVTGDGPNEMVEENLEQQRAGAKLSAGEAEYNTRTGRASAVAPRNSLAQELRRAGSDLAPPPGESAATAEYARWAAILVACLRYSGLDENELQIRLDRLDRSIIRDQAEFLNSADADDAPEAAGLLDQLLRRTDVEIDQVMAIASVGASRTY